MLQLLFRNAFYYNFVILFLLFDRKRLLQIFLSLRLECPAKIPVNQISYWEIKVVNIIDTDSAENFWSNSIYLANKVILGFGLQCDD